MDESCPRVEAVYTENGRIVKRGTKEEAEAYVKADTQRIDLKGKTLLPGFIDGHSHFTGLANSLSQCDLSESVSFSDIIERMRSFIQENEIPEGEWVVGTNYDHNFLEEKRHPDRKILDEISEKHPVLVIHASSHMGVVNTKGLESQKLDAGVEDPEGGHYGRDQKTGELDGYMEENAFVAFRNAMPMIGIDKLMELMKKAQEIYAGYGVTTVQEGMVTPPLFQLLKYAEKNKVLYLDLAAYFDLEQAESFEKDLEEYQNHYRNHLKAGGFKMFLDGSPQGRTAWMKEPYEKAEDGYRGYPIKKDSQVENLILTALKKKQQILTHCNGDAAAEQLITQFEKVCKEHPEIKSCRPVMVHAQLVQKEQLERMKKLSMMPSFFVVITQFEKVCKEHPEIKSCRPVMVHAQLVQKEQLERMKKLSMMPSFFVAHTYYWGDIHIENFGMERAKNISPAGSAQKMGIPYTFHQDSPVLMPDVFRTIWCAVRRTTRNGVELDQEESVSAYEALKAMTVNAAYQYFEENEKGSIEEGKLADLIIVDKDPLSVSADEAYEALKAMTVNAAYQYFEENEKGSIEEGKLADLIIVDKDPLSVSADELKDILVLETFKEGVSVFRRQ